MMEAILQHGEIVEMGVGARGGQQWQSFRLGWPAYIRPLLMALVRVLVLGGGSAAFVRHVIKRPDLAGIATAVGLLLTLAWLIYDWKNLRSVVFYTDPNGVWVERGVLPWNRGVYGVKWRDISEATCELGFLSWALRSYTVRIGHRFTNGQELRVANLFRGNQATGHVNDVLVNPGAFIGN